MPELTLPGFIHPEAMNRFDLKTLHAQCEAHITALGRQMVHTTLAHLLRDCEGLEALVVQCGSYGYNTRSAIEPVWSNQASKADKKYYKTVTKGLFARMVQVTANARHALLFDGIDAPELQRIQLDFRTEELTIPKHAWEAYLRVGVPEAVRAHMAALGLEGALKVPPELVASSAPSAKRTRL